MSQEAESSDHESLKQLLEAILPQLPMLARRMMSETLQGFVSPEDMAQQAAAELIAGLPRFTPRTADTDGDLHAWANEVLRNRIRDAGRKLDLAFPTLEESVLEQAKSDGRTPSRVAAKGETLASVRECLQELRPEDRDIIWRHVVEGRTIRQVATELALTEGQVEGRFRRSLRQLAEMLGSRGKYQFTSSRG